MHVQAYAVPFDRGFVHCELVHDEANPRKKSILKIKSRNFDPSMLSSDQAVTGASLEAITALAQARVHNPFPW